MRRNTCLIYSVPVIIAAAIGLCSCVFHHHNGTPVSIPSLTSPIASSPERAALFFDEFIPGRPLNETVWGSLKGPWWSETESREVGFYYTLTANEFKFDINNRFPGQVVLPFGRSLSGVLASAVKQSFPASSVCFNRGCFDDAIAAQRPRFTIKVRIVNFRVWEGTSTYLNFYARVSTDFEDLKNNTRKQQSFEKFMLGEKAGWETMHNGRRHRFFAPVSVQTAANKFTSSLAVDMMNYYKECIEGGSTTARPGS